MSQSPLLSSNPKSARELLDSLTPRGVRLGLGPIRALLAKLGHPEQATPVLLIGGTNGKGSVAALTDAALRQAGYRVVRSTSPHLVDPCERITIEGKPIPDPELLDYLQTVESHARDLVAPTYFEAVIAATFLVARSHRADVLVLEVGMGGRLDATNVSSPLVSVITPIGLDHTQELGNSVEAIAREKAGILRPGRTAVIAPQLPAAWSVLTEVAEAVGAHLVSVADTAHTLCHRFLGLNGHELQCRTNQGLYTFHLPLAGEHQVDNARTALVACEALRAAGFSALDRKAVEEGFERVSWPGRLEAFRLPGYRGTVLIDGAHNQDGCKALARFLGRLDLPYALLFGCLRDRAPGELLAPLASKATRLVATTPPSPRALEASKVVEATQNPSSSYVFLEPEPESALFRLLEGPEPLKVIAGSLYLVGHLRPRLCELAGPTPRW